jgi:hypothetical protein
MWIRWIRIRGSGSRKTDKKHQNIRKLKFQISAGQSPHLHLLTKIHCSSNVIVDSNLHRHREVGLAERGKNQKNQKCLSKTNVLQNRP